MMSLIIQMKQIHSLRCMMKFQYDFAHLKFRADLGPCLADVVVAPKHQKQGIGKMLVDVAARQAKERCVKKLCLFAFDPTIPEYYKRLGWGQICMDEFQSHPIVAMEVEL